MLGQSCFLLRVNHFFLSLFPSNPLYHPFDSMQTICVQNISVETTEFDLESVFQTYGTIRRVNVIQKQSKDKANKWAFAFVTFSRQSDAEAAMEALQAHKYDYMIWRLDWAKPRKPRKSTQERSGGECQRHRRKPSISSSVTGTVATAASSVSSLYNSRHR